MDRIYLHRDTAGRLAELLGWQGWNAVMTNAKTSIVQSNYELDVTVASVIILGQPRFQELG